MKEICEDCKQFKGLCDVYLKNKETKKEINARLGGHSFFQTENAAKAQVLGLSLSCIFLRFGS